MIEDALAGVAAGKTADIRVVANPDRRFVDPGEYERQADCILDNLSAITTLIRGCRTRAD